MRLQMLLLAPHTPPDRQSHVQLHTARSGIGETTGLPVTIVVLYSHDVWTLWCLLWSLNYEDLVHRWWTRCYSYHGSGQAMHDAACMVFKLSGMNAVYTRTCGKI